MKAFEYITIAIALSISTSAFSAADGKTKSDTTELKPYARTSKGNVALKSPTLSASSSRRVMLDGMENPVIRDAFHKAQLDLLQTPSDALLYRFFTTDKVAAPMYSQLKMASGKMLDDYSLDAKSNMLQLVRGLTPKYDSFDKLFVEIGIDSGIREGVIDSRELYLMPGSLNAATVSGNQDKMIALVSDSLLATMSKKELAAVLAHEVGHIRAEHPVKGMMNNFMMSVVAELFISGKIEINQEVAFKLNSLPAEHSGICNGACGHSRNLGVSNLVGVKSSFTSGAIENFVKNLQNMPREMFMQSVASYLNVLVQIGELEKAHPQTIEYFRTLEMAVGRIGTFKIQPQEFMEHAQEISLAYSRGKEKTADTISSSLTRNINLASASAKLMGSEFENTDKEAQQRIFEQIRKQAREVQKKAGANGTMYRRVGSTHPALAHRALRILDTEAYPAVLFANGFLKQLMILERLMTAEYYAKETLRGYNNQANIQAFLKSKLEEYKKAGATEQDLKQVEERLIKNIENTKLAHSIEFIENSKARFELEIEIIKLIFDPEFPITAKRSPRFENLIQFLAVQKEVKIAAAHGVSITLDQARTEARNPLTALMNQSRGLPDPAEIVAGLEAQLEGIKRSIQLQDDFANKIKVRLLEDFEKNINPQEKEMLKQRYALLLRVIQASETLQLEQIRAKATPITVLNNGLRDISNKIPVRVNHGEPLVSPFAKSCSRLFN